MPTQHTFTYSSTDKATTYILIHANIKIQPSLKAELSVISFGMFLLIKVIQHVCEGNLGHTCNFLFFPILLRKSRHCY